MVRRLYVEKKPGFDIEANHILCDLNESLGIKSKLFLRLFNRYDCEGLNDSDYESAKRTIFSEPNSDNTYDEILPVDSGDVNFAVEYLPGQYDQRADSAAQCIQLQNGAERPIIVSAKVYALSGNIISEELDKIKAYLVNPVEARIAAGEKPQSLDIRSDIPDNIATVTGFISMSDDEIAEYHKTMGFAMTVSDLCFCRDYFKCEKRNPTITELKVIDTYWSDHCRHTTFSTILQNISVDNGSLNTPIKATLDEYFEARREVYGERKKDVSLMDIATMGMRLLKKKGLIPDLDESEEINACSIEVPVEIDGKTEQWLIQFKNETHNHPTEIEPFGGAATCLGGAIRDPLSGRSYVYQAMRVTGSGDPTISYDKTLKGKLPTKKITVGAAQGYSSYGNQIGLSTGQVTELYHPGYVAKRLEIGAVVGASPKSNVVREIPSDGDIIVLLGGRTGRDGCGGATGSSKAHDTSSTSTCGAEVQKGNAPTERKIQRLFRNPQVSTMIKRCNDFGAGGICVAIGELSDGLKINLDCVSKKYEGLDGTELAISESQERMAVVLSPENVDKFIGLSENENLEATVVATVTKSPILSMFWRNTEIVNLKREFLNTNGVTGHTDVRITAVDENKNYRETVPPEFDGINAADAFILNLGRLSVASQKGLSERFDSSIGAATVLMPFGGKNQLTPEEAMVAKLPITDGESDNATAMSFGYIPALTEESPYHGSALAIMESLSKLVAVGADPLSARLTFQEYFERLYDKPERWGKTTAALLGAFKAQKEMGVPSIGGKDSMSGSFNDLDVPPTLVSFALSMTSARRTISAAIKKAESNLLFIPIPMDKSTRLPDFSAAKNLYKSIHSLIKLGKISSIGVVKEGGTAAVSAKMAFGNGFGIEFKSDDMTLLFAPISASFVVETDDISAFKGVNYTILGVTTEKAVFKLGGKEISMDKALSAYTKTFENVFPTVVNPISSMKEIPLYTERNRSAPLIKSAKPGVFIPAFPGTNCEYDTARAFKLAGAEPDILVVKNLTPAHIEETIEEMVRRIEKAQIIMLPGGFSGGDEPDGSGKFIATTFRNPLICEAVMNLLKQRDGLMLGICNGFQALIKLGLVPYGEIRDIKENDSTLTFNTIGRHVSQMVYTRVTSVKSPWLAQCKTGDIHSIPISHGEGRFVADETVLKALSKNGQIATQYVDLDGNPANDMPFNPNGSLCGIEGITSSDGRIFGKMGHSERKRSDCYKNIPGNKDQKIFESGVNYFK